MAARDAMHQLERYFGEPHESLAALLHEVAELNDDIYHGRARSCIVQGVAKVRYELEALESALLKRFDT